MWSCVAGFTDYTDITNDTAPKILDEYRILSARLDGILYCDMTARRGYIYHKHYKSTMVEKNKKKNKLAEYILLKLDRQWKN